jgi:serine/threonine-protein kinase
MVDGAKEAPTERAKRYDVVLPPAFDEWFLRATAKNPSERFDRASALVFALAEVLGVPIQQRSPRASIPEGDWEIESALLSNNAIPRFVSVSPDAPQSNPTPSVPVVGAVSVVAASGLVSPNAIAPLLVPSIPPLVSVPPTNPTPLGTHVEVPSTPPAKPNRRSIWVLMALALVIGFLGVLILSGPFSTKPEGNKLPTTGDTASSASSTPLPIPDAGTETDAEVPVIPASAAASSPTPLPSASSIGTTVPSGKRNPTTKTKQNKPYDPLKKI